MATMTTSTRLTNTTTRPSRRARAVAVIGAVAATLTIWAIAGPLAGIDLAIRVGSGAGSQPVGPIAVATVSLLAGLAGWGLLVILEGCTQRAGSVWTIFALVALVLSLAGPLGAGIDTATKLALAGMHLVAAAILIPLLAWTSNRR